MQSEFRYRPKYKSHPNLVLATAVLLITSCGANPPTSSSSVSSVTSTSTSTSTATSSTSSASSSSEGIPSSASLVYAINAGTASEATFGGVTYRADRFASGGDTQTITDPISGTDEDALYQSERFGTYSYEIPVTAATYSVKLHMVEMYHSAGGMRNFNITVEGIAAVTNLDLFAEVGQHAAYEVTLNGVSVSDGYISIELETNMDNATVSGIAIYSGNGGKFEEPPAPVCNDSQRQTPRRVNYATEFKDQQYFDGNVARPPTGPRGFVIEQATSLQNHTIYRPQTLMEGDKLPIIAWGNGACSNDGLSQADFLSEVASHGYIAIANGAPGGGGSNDGRETELIKAINWAIAENSRECSQFYGKLDVDSIASMGWSCGGAMAHYAATDPRVDTGIALNSGMYAGDRFDVYARFHSPIAIFNGNSSDVAYNNGLAAYNDITDVPVYHSNHANLGHGDAYFQDNGGDMGRAVVGWLNWQLKGDTSATGRERFFGNNCFMCRSPWTSKNKGF